MGVKVYNTSEFCWYWLSTKLQWTKTASTTSRLGTFSPFFVLSINFFVLPNNFVVSGVCNSSFYPSFILNTSLLLILLMETWIGGIAVNVSYFLMINSI